MKWVQGFCPERVFGGAGEGPHVQTNAMLAPSPRRDFSVGNGRAVISPKQAPQWLPLPLWAYESREKNSPGTGAAPPSRRRYPVSGRDTSRQVYFQLQSRIIQAPQRILQFASSTAEEANQSRATLLPWPWDSFCVGKNPGVPIAFAPL